MEDWRFFQGIIIVSPSVKMVQVRKVLLILLLLGLGIFNHDQVSCFTQQDLNYIASNLDVYYEVVDNLDSSQAYTSKLTLTNKGKQEITKGPWAIYFNFIRLIEPDYLMDNPSGYVIPDVGLKFVHVAGSLFKLEPVQGFQSLTSNQSLSFKFVAQHHSVAKTDAMPNWYVSADGLYAVNLERTAGEELSFVGKFDTAKQWKRGKDDQYNPFTPTSRWKRIKVEAEKPALGSIIPTPVQLRVKDEQYVDINDWEIVTTKFENEAKYLGEKLKLSVKNYTGKDSKVIHLLHKNVDVKIDGQASTSKERYTVDVEENVITISAPNPSGCFYGITSLLAITDIEKKQVLKVSIKDAPRFKYRGLMLDISRNFHGKSSILKVLKAMANYKLNKLHIHLSDDEGWRLEIPGLEELTKFGGSRCSDTKKCLAPQIGSGAKTSTSGSGYLTVTQYKEILQLAKTLHIEIIPEFDMPGHSHAAIKAMEYRFLKYNASSNETMRKDASNFLLAELDDSSKYFSVQMFRDNAVNPCLNSTYNFIEHVLSTLVRIHENIAPLKLFHMGGDEVAKGAWINSTACEPPFTIPDKEIDSLKKYFTSRLSAITAKYNISFAAWEDGLIENGILFNKTHFSPNVYGYAWDNVWEWNAFDRAYRLANAGYKTVLGHATHLYFDMPYEPNPEERGYYWATRFTDTMKTFEYMPDSVYDNAKEDRMGNPLNKQKLCEEESNCPPLVRKDNIVGIQGHLWSETVRTEDQLFYMCFPRVLALAERAWHKAQFEKHEDSRKEMFDKEWRKFANLLGYRELRKLDEMGVKYRVPLPGAKLESGRWLVSSAFPGLKIEYNAGKEWKEYSSSVPKLSGSVRFRTKSADGKRSSREIKLDFPLPSGSKVVSPAAFIQFVMLVSFLFFI